MGGFHRVGRLGRSRQLLEGRGKEGGWTTSTLFSIYNQVSRCFLPNPVTSPEVYPSVLAAAEVMESVTSFLVSCGLQ